MHLSTSEVIHAPRDAVFAAVTDFDAIERQVVRAGATLTRPGADGPGANGPGAAWQGTALIKGTPRDFTTRVAGWTPPESYRLITQTKGLDALVDVRCIAVNDATTRLEVLVDLTPHSLKARILLNSLKLMRSQITARFKQRIRKLADTLEQGTGGG